MNTNQLLQVFYRCSYLLLVIGIVGCNESPEPFRDELKLDWKFKKVSDSVWHQAVVPGAVQIDLLYNDLISDPFVGINEKKIQWIEGEQWLYQSSFNLTAPQINSTHLELVFTGLDTYAEVYLNDNLILSADNMFRTYTIDILKWARKGSNDLHIKFTSPLEKNKDKVQALPYKLPAGSETGEWQVSPFTRKAAYQFGWDFAPRIQTMGIWRPIYLKSWANARIMDVQFLAMRISEEVAEYELRLSTEVAKPGEYTLEVNDQVTSHTLNSGLNIITTSWVIPEPELWWPNGLGEPYRYSVPIRLLKEGNVVDSLDQKIGVRDIKLIQEEDQIGESYYFMVNGKKVFMKGVNWSPLSSYPSSIPDSVYINRIQAIKEANMNMLRVWGGGIYETDLFYELCDANGILVWQDFMFANTMYPGDSVFIQNVKEEVKEQIIRLRNHPSVAAWNGNNEIDVAWHNWGWQDQYGYTSKDSTQLWQDYLNLFEDLIPDLVTQLDPQRSYTSTSPLSNWGTSENFNSGSMHYWGVWHGNDNFDGFKGNVGRFMAEYGFQSYPNKEIFSTYYQLANFEIDSNEHLHQKSYVGNKHIKRESEKYFGVSGNFEDFLENSQLTQAMALKIAIEAHRLAKDKCGGTLFWQLNDCWPGPSWSVIDYYGEKKIAYSVVKDRYKPLILVPAITDNKFEISLVNDYLERVDGVLKMELFKASNERVWLKEMRVDIAENEVKEIYRSDIRKILDGMKPENVYLKLTLIGSDSIMDIENVYFTLPKNYLGKFDLVGRD